MGRGFVLLIMCELSVILLVHKLLKRSKSVNNKNSNIFIIQTTVKPVLTWPTKQTLLAHHTISDPHWRKSTCPTNTCNFDLSKIQLHSIAI